MHQGVLGLQDHTSLTEGLALNSLAGMSELGLCSHLCVLINSFVILCPLWVCVCKFSATYQSLIILLQGLCCPGYSPLRAFFFTSALF